MCNLALSNYECALHDLKAADRISPGVGEVLEALEETKRYLNQSNTLTHTADDISELETDHSDQ
jgi:hypothetical protein